jgi:hypothetical protein
MSVTTSAREIAVFVIAFVKVRIGLMSGFP